MSNTFLRLELASAREAGNTYPPTTMLLNVDHIVRIHPTWPQGCTLVTTDDASLHATASLDEIQAQMHATNGRIMIKWIGRGVIVDIEPEFDAVYEAARTDLQP